MKHDWQSVEMPPRIAALPRDPRGFPITFVTLITSDGRPDFTTIDAQKIIRCIQEGLCGLCGQGLGDTLAFIGGPLSIENLNFLDPAMHPECATYAMKVCPHIAIDTARYSKPNLEDGEGRELFPHVSDDRPEKFGLLLTGGASIASLRGQPVFLADEGAVTWQEDLE